MKNIHGDELCSQAEAVKYLMKWYLEQGKPNWDDGDRDVATWLERDGKAIQNRIEDLKNEGVAKQLLALAQVRKSALLDGFAKVFETLSPEEKEMVIKQIQA